MWQRLCSVGQAIPPWGFTGAILLLGCMASASALAQDWGGPFTIIPVSAPEMVLEAVDSGTAEGTKVSIGSPSGKPNQKWTVTPQGAALANVGDQEARQRIGRPRPETRA